MNTSYCQKGENKVKPINGELIYTGGGIYVGVGQTDDGNWYMADYENDGVRIINADPNKFLNNGEDVWLPEWQEEHFVMDYDDGSIESVTFLYQSLEIIDNYAAKILSNDIENSYYSEYYKSFKYENFENKCNELELTEIFKTSSKDIF